MTPWTGYWPADPARLRSALEGLAPQRPDVFMTPDATGLPGNCVAGLWPEAELRLRPGDGVERLKAFCFGGAQGGTSGGASGGLGEGWPEFRPGPALGFLSYPAGFAGLGLTPPRGDFPLGVFRKYRVVLVQDRLNSRVRVLATSAAALDMALRLLGRITDFAFPSLPAFSGALGASLSATAYRQAVHQAREAILDGHIYQLNLSIRFETEWPDALDPAQLFWSLGKRHPAPFYSLYYDSPYAILSTSPERFLRVRGGEVLSQPIKGTRLAGKDVLASAAALTASAKEDRELSMIVDLIRNDIAARCAYGSVAVEGHKSLFLVDDLLQMYANVQGRLRPGSTCLDLLWDALPPGSVTGCPKKRAVEIIDRLEPHRRDAYCGCMAVVWDERTMDSSVAIRTAVLDEAARRLAFYAGSGIVVDGLLQMYANVQGRLRQGATCLDLLWSALPPGSVTGCPKKRAVEIIDRLEPHRRDAYCGCMAVVWDRQSMDSSVAIRTAVVDEAAERLAFFAGSGIVVDSDPYLEYQETLAKAGKFFDLVNRHPGEP